MFVLLQIIAAVVLFMKEQKHIMFAFLISLTAVHLVTGRLQSAKTENQKLIDEKTQSINSLKEQLQLTESTNQRLLDEKKELQNEIDHNNAELQSVKDNMQKLLDEKKECEKKSSQIIAELQSSKESKQRSLEEKKELEKKISQMTAELLSSKDSNQRLAEEDKEFEKKINQITAKFQSCKDTNQWLFEEKQQFQKKADQINTEHHLVIRENQRLLEEKIKILEKIDHMNDDQKIYNTQLQLIDKCMDLINRLEDDVRAMIHCRESKGKRSLYANSLLCSKVGFNFDESFTGEVILREVDLIMKYRVICTNFMDALLMKKIEQMKKQQAKYDMEKLKEEMEKLFKEVSADPKYQQSKQKDVERYGILAILYKFGEYVFRVIAGVFFS